MEGPTPHESPWQITLPLWILGGLSVVAGFLNANAIYHFTHADSLIPLDKFLAPVFKGARTSVSQVEDAAQFGGLGLGLALFAVVAGVYGAYYVYIEQKGAPAEDAVKKAPGLHAFLKDKWRVDEFYEETVIGAVDSLADLCVLVDRWVVDGILARFTAFTVSVFGTILRQFQSGRLQTYAVVMVVGLVFVGCYVVAPQDNLRVTADHKTGKYEILATPGFGYLYRWDEDGDGEWDSDTFGEKSSVTFSLKPNTSRTVKVQVESAFGHVNEETIDIVRPALDLSRGEPTLVIERGADGKIRPRGASKLPDGHPGIMKPVDPGKKRAPKLEDLQRARKSQGQGEEAPQ